MESNPEQGFDIYGFADTDKYLTLTLALSLRGRGKNVIFAMKQYFLPIFEPFPLTLSMSKGEKVESMKAERAKGLIHCSIVIA